MTGELRESLAKLAKSHAEKAKVGVRKARQKGTADLKKKTSGSISEDTVHRLEKYVCQGNSYTVPPCTITQHFFSYSKWQIGTLPLLRRC